MSTQAGILTRHDSLHSAVLGNPCILRSLSVEKIAGRLRQVCTVFETALEFTAYRARNHGEELEPKAKAFIIEENPVSGNWVTQLCRLPEMK